jgi:hypothetical protein
MKYKFFLCCAFGCLLHHFAASQSLFHAGPVLGLSASQINGDQLAGYDKLGLTGGLRVTGALKERAEASIEFLYSQRGAQTELIKRQYSPNYSLSLNYLEVPLQWHYKDWLVEGETEAENYYKVSFNGGFSWARFLGSKVNDEDGWFSGVAPEFIRKNDFSLLIGANFFVNRHLGFTFRYVRSLRFAYDPRDWEQPPVSRAWLPHSLYFYSFYMF